MADLFGGLTNPTAILETFKNEAIKILNDIANKQADELVQGIIREKVTDNMNTIFNSGYVQQAAASAFNSTIYPEYIRRLKNLEAFLTVSAGQDNELKTKLGEALKSTNDADKTPEKIIEIINTWANGLKPTTEEIKNAIKGQPNVEFNTAGNILEILNKDKEQEQTYETKKQEADTNNGVAVAPMAVPTPVSTPVPEPKKSWFSNPFSKTNQAIPNQAGGKKTKRNRRQRQRKSQRIN